MQPSNDRESHRGARSVQKCLKAGDGSSSSSSSSSSSESSTDPEMGLVVLCTIFSENSEAESGCRGGPVTHDLTAWDFSKADCRITD